MRPSVESVIVVDRAALHSLGSNGEEIAGYGEPGCTSSLVGRFGIGAVVLAGARTAARRRTRV